MLLKPLKSHTVFYDSISNRTKKKTYNILNARHKQLLYKFEKVNQKIRKNYLKKNVLKKNLLLTIIYLFIYFMTVWHEVFSKL